MSIISPVAEKFLNDINSDIRINILKIFKGENAVEKIKRLFFEEGQEEKANEWTNKWTPLLRSQSVFIIYSYNKDRNIENYSQKNRKNTYIHFKFCIGNHDTGSCLGEKYKYGDSVEKLILLMD